MSDFLFDICGMFHPKSPLSPEATRRIAEIVSETSAFTWFSSGVLDVEIMGTRSVGWIVTPLAEVAAVFGEAEGEVECSYYNEGGAPCFAFYMIKNGRLIVQDGVVVRSEERPVDIEAERSRLFEIAANTGED